MYSNSLNQNPDFFVEIDTMVIKFILKCNEPRIAKITRKAKIKKIDDTKCFQRLEQFEL